LCLASMH